MSSSVFHIPKSRHPELIGRSGSNLRDLQTKFNVKVTVPGRDEGSSEVIVSGTPEDVELAREQIEKTLGIKTGKPHAVWSLDIAQSNFSRLIGSGGSTLRKLQDDHHVRINVPRQGAKEKESYVTAEGQEDDIQALVTAISSLLTTEVTRVSSSSSSASSSSSSSSASPQVTPPAPSLPAGPFNKVIFFPDKDTVNTPNFQEFLKYLAAAKKTLDICVFTITDDRIASVIVKAHAHGVKVRIITDNDQASQLGSDIEKFKSAGIPTKLDTSPFHMHHKFAVIDGSFVVNGSFNWTKGAATNNCENIMATNHQDFVRSFAAHFETMWKDEVNFK